MYERALEAHRQQRANVERATTQLVGLTFRSTVGVSIRKPRWMPERMYRYLMRTIVVTETPLVTETGQR